MRIILPLVVLLLVAGCGLWPGKSPFRPDPVTGSDPAQADAAVTAPSGLAALGTRSARPEDLDTTSAADKETALAATATSGERTLGTAVVALGPPAEQGIWLKTPLVTEVVQGRVETATGQSLAVELRPGTGGALLSLAAFQALGLALTELPEVTVYAP
ncbi:MAG: hypothetical protein B7Z31_14795 [Rhodobacterales bacterium 12-65-15]|nr:MAG: hypothetical protein B7Z31_14795 [Rhodobacterales bacterium 12-65-15]